MKLPWHESQGVLPWLFLLAIALVFVLGIREGWLSDFDLVKYKDAIDSATKIVATVLLFIGGLLSYFRFFKGRTLRPKLNLIPTIGFISLNNDENLHWIDVQIENKGSVAVWNYTIKIDVRIHGTQPYWLHVTDFMPSANENFNGEILIDVGESAYEHAFVKIPKDLKEFQVLTFQVRVTDQKGTTWSRCITSKNSTESTDIQQAIK